MTIKKMLFLSLGFLCTERMAAQSNFGLSSAKVSLGSIGEGTRGFGTLDDFRKLAPTSKMLQSANMLGYTNILSGYGGNSGIFSIELGFENKNSRRKSSRISYQIGITNIGSFGETRSTEKTNTYRVDTFTSSQSGAQFFRDSVVTDRLFMRYSASEFRFDGGMKISTNPNLRWSVFGGVAIGAGTVYNARTNISQSQSRSSTSPNTENGFTSFYSYEYFSSEEFKNKSGMNIYVATPIGIDFRIGKRREFWKRLHLVGEVRPGINRRKINNGIDSYTTTFTQQSLGVKVNW